jgi:hypothetical protein
MKINLSTAIVATVTVAVVLYIVLEFTGVVGDKPGKTDPGLFLILVLLIGSLFRLNRRRRVSSGADR